MLTGRVPFALGYAPIKFVLFGLIVLLRQCGEVWLSTITSSFHYRSDELEFQVLKFPCNFLSCLPGFARQDKFSSLKSDVPDSVLLVNITAEVTKREDSCGGWGHPELGYHILFHIFVTRLKCCASNMDINNRY